MSILSEDHVVVWADKQLQCFSAADGQPVWQRDVERKVTDLNVEAVDSTGIALFFQRLWVDQRTPGYWRKGFLITALDIGTGEEVWTSQVMGRDCYRMKVLPERGQVLIIYRDMEKKERWTARRLENGETEWDNRTLFDGTEPDTRKIEGIRTLEGNQEFLFDTDSTMITLMNRHRIRKWDINQGELIWETKIKARKTPWLSDGWASMTFSADSSVVYFATDRKVSAVRTADGSMVWEKPKELDGEIAEIFPVEHGVLAKSIPDDRHSNSKAVICLLDTDSGRPVWSAERGELKNLKRATNSAIKDGRMIYWAANKLFSVGIGSGDVRILTDDVKFDGHEHPLTLEVLDEGIVLASLQNVSRRDWEGNLLYHTYYPCADPGTLGYIGMIAESLAIQFAANALGNAIFNRSGGPDYITLPDIDPNNYKESLTTETHLIMLAKLDVEGKKKASVVKVNLATGETIDTLLLPGGYDSFVVPRTGNTALVAQKNLLHCYRLE